MLVKPKLVEPKSAIAPVFCGRVEKSDGCGAVVQEVTQLPPEHVCPAAHERYCVFLMTDPTLQ